jgi:hypothetical protein
VTNDLDTLLTALARVTFRKKPWDGARPRKVLASRQPVAEAPVMAPDQQRTMSRIDSSPMTS